MVEEQKSTEEKKGKRIFVYDGREFPDPDPNLSNEEVKKMMSDFFPELANAEIREHKKDENTLVELVKRVGTKG
jgi:PRTRC genetic system protein C